MQRALAELEARGLLETQRTAGRTVTSDTEKLAQARQSLARKLVHDFYRQAAALGLTKAELAALAATLRLFFCAPAQVAKRQKNANDALLVWYRAAEDALLCMGLSSLPGEAPASFLWRAQCELHDAVKLTGLGKALCVAQYSGRTLKPIQPERARKVYAELLAQMTFRQRLRLYVRRLIHGLRLS